jgi:hypothetical protein
MFRTLIRTSLVILASAVCLVPADAATKNPPPKLTGQSFSGIYDRGGSESFSITVMTQKGRNLTKVRIDAMNESQSRGTGRISKDNLTFKATLHTPGKKKDRHIFRLDGTLGGGGTSLSGNYTLLRGTTTLSTGTFSVSR